MKLAVVLIIAGCGGVDVKPEPKPITCEPTASTSACEVGGWSVGKIGAGGWNVSLALARDGSAHLAYQGSDRRMRYASVGSPPAIEVIDPDRWAAWETAIAVDDCGGIHVAYFDFESYDLLYAYRAPNAVEWTTETVDAEGSVGWHVSLVVAGDNVHLLYYDTALGDLRYAHRANGGAWKIEGVAADRDAGRYAKLAFDATGTAHIVFATDNTITYGYRPVGGTWQLERVTGGEEPSLALDVTGTPHIAYGTFTPKEVRHAWRTNGAWNIESAATESRIKDPMIAVAPNSTNVDIVYFDLREDVVHLTRDGSWRSEIASTDTGTARDLRFAIDVRGGLHVAYFNQFGEELMYATTCQK